MCRYPRLILITYYRFINMIARALISVTDKTNLHKLAPFLVDRGVQLISTGGTLKYLKQHNIKVTDISAFTGFPEMMDGRLKTLHPKIHGGILHRREEEVDAELAKEQGIELIDLVVVNLYNFEKTISNPHSTFEESIENIDIGGPTLLRAAAKNHKHVTVLSNPSDYDEFMDRYDTNTEALRRRYAQKVFAHTAKYDDIVSLYLYRNLF